MNDSMNNSNGIDMPLKSINQSLNQSLIRSIDILIKSQYSQEPILTNIHYSGNGYSDQILNIFGRE